MIDGNGNKRDQDVNHLKLILPKMTGRVSLGLFLGSTHKMMMNQLIRIFWQNFIEVLEPHWQKILYETEKKIGGECEIFTRVSEL